MSSNEHNGSATQYDFGRASTFKVVLRPYVCHVVKETKEILERFKELMENSNIMVPPPHDIAIELQIIEVWPSGEEYEHMFDLTPIEAKCIGIAMAENNIPEVSASLEHGTFPFDFANEVE
jgi:hypothetical protein